MVDEVIKLVQLKWDEVEGNDSIFVLIGSVYIDAFVAAAADNCVQNEDRNARSDKERVLKQVNYQVRVQVRSAWLSDKISWLETGFPALSHVLYKPDGVAHDSRFDGPLDRRPDGEAAVAAWLLQEAVTECVVDAVENADSSSLALHLRVKAKIDKQVVVKHVENCQHHADRQKYKQSAVLRDQLFLFLDRLYEPDSTTYDQSCQHEQGCQFHIL